MDKRAQTRDSLVLVETLPAPPAEPSLDSAELHLLDAYWRAAN